MRLAFGAFLAQLGVEADFPSAYRFYHANGGRRATLGSSSSSARKLSMTARFESSLEPYLEAAASFEELTDSGG